MNNKVQPTVEQLLELLRIQLADWRFHQSLRAAAAAASDRSPGKPREVEPGEE